MAERKQLYSVVIDFNNPGILASSVTAYDTEHLEPRKMWHTGGKNGDYIQIPECAREEDFLANHIEIVFPNWGQVMFWTNPALGVVETTSLIFNGDVQPPVCDRQVLKRCYQNRQMAAHTEGTKLNLSVSASPDGEFDLNFTDLNTLNHSDSWQGVALAAQKS